MEPLNAFSLSSARSVRLMTLTEIAAAMKKISDHEEPLRQLLVKGAPASVAQFLDDEGTIDLLFMHGQSSTHIDYPDNSYNLKTARQIKSAFGQLEKAWKNAVKITCSDGESHRVRITFKIP